MRATLQFALLIADTMLFGYLLIDAFDLFVLRPGLRCHCRHPLANRFNFKEVTTCQACGGILTLKTWHKRRWA